MPSISIYLTDFEIERLRQIAKKKGFVSKEKVPDVTKAAQLIVRDALNHKVVDI